MYTLRVIAPGLPGSEGSTNGSGSSGIQNWTIGVAAAASVFLLMILVLVVMLRRNRVQRKAHDFDEDLVELMDEGVIKEKRVPRELPRAAVQQLDKLGGGAFGDVYKGMLDEPGSSAPAYLVAIKVLKGEPSASERREFLREAAIMAQIKHRNVVSLVGVVTKGEPYMVLLQFCEHGSLDSFLKKHTGMLDLSLLARLQIARDVCEGCCYLSENGFIHRDIAARNVLIGSDWICKLADFGMTRAMEDSNYYIQGERGKLPVRWSAPEVMENGKFSERSDVWAYGIVLYEVFTRGEIPYKGWSNQKVWQKVTAGYRLEAPPNTPEDAFAIMTSTWEPYALRPTFKELSPRVQKLVTDEMGRCGIQLGESASSSETFLPLTSSAGLSQATTSTSGGSAGGVGAGKRKQSEANAAGMANPYLEPVPYAKAGAAGGQSSAAETSSKGDSFGFGSDGSLSGGGMSMNPVYQYDIAAPDGEANPYLSPALRPSAAQLEPDILLGEARI